MTGPTITLSPADQQRIRRNVARDYRMLRRHMCPIAAVEAMRNARAMAFTVSWTMYDCIDENAGYAFLVTDEYRAAVRRQDERQQRRVRVSAR